MPLFNASIDLDKNELQNAVIHVSSGKPSTPKLGQIFFDSDVNQIQVCTNASGPVWQGLVSEVVDTDNIYNAALKIGRDSDNHLDFATADNTIDIYLNNAKDFTFTANTFTAQSGSTIAGQVITGTTIDATTDFTIGNLVITDNTLTGSAIAIAGGSGEIDLTTTGAIDLNSAAFTLDGTTISIDGTDDVNLTVTSSTAGEDLTIAQVGANDSSIIITAAGTGTDAVKIDATAGDMLIAPTLINGKTLKIGPVSATQMVFTPSGTAGSEKISLINTSGTADDAIKIDSVAGGLTLAAGNDSLIIDADGTDADALNIDSAGGIDVDAAGVVAIDSVGLSIDSAGVAANITSTSDGAGEDFTIALAGATDSSLILSSTGTAADALQISTSAGGMDITVAGAAAGEDLDITSDSSINVTATEDAANAIYIRTNAGTSETLKIHSDQGTGAGSIEVTSDAGSIDINAGDNITVDASDEIIITTGSANGHIALVSAHTAGQAIHLDGDANAGSIVDIDAGILDIDVTAGVSLDATTMSIDGTDDSNLTVTAAGKDLDIAVVGGDTQELRLASAGTGASALWLKASAGSVNIDAGDAITVDAADEIVITTTSADGHISLVSAHTAGQAVHIDANANAGSILDIDAGILDIDVDDAITIDAADEIVITTGSADGHISLVSAHTAGQAIHLDGDANAGSIVDIDAGILDIDVTAGVTLDATTMSIDGTDDSNITVTASGKDLDLIVAGGGTQELRLTSAGTGASALDLTTSAGGIDINSADMITVDAADEIVVTTTSADGHISLVTAHTAGQALHIDANANAGSIVDIDAGILDIDVTGVSTIDTTLLTLTGAGGLKILDTTASAATEGGSLILANDDGAVMADNHRLGVIEFQGAEDTSNTLTTGARIEAICDAEWSASENGASLLFYTTDANATQGVALTLDSDQKATFAAAVHVAGNLTVAGTTTTQNTVLIENTVTTLVFEGAEDDLHETTLKVVEPTADCTFSLPTLTAGNFFLPAIADTATDASAAVTAAEFALLDGGSTIGTTAIVDADGIFSNNGGAMMHTQVTTYQTYFDANSVGGSNIVTTGTIGTGVWNGTVIANAYLDADTAHLTEAQTFTGSKTMSTNVKLNFRDGNSYINSPSSNDLEIVCTDLVIDAATLITLEQDTVFTDKLYVDDKGGEYISGDGTTATMTGAWASANMTITGGAVTGITDLVVADGGTGVSTLTDGGILIGSGTGAITAMAVLANSEMIVGDGTTDPVAESGATLRTSIGCNPVAGSSSITTLGTIGTGVWQGTKIADAYLSDNTAHLDTTQTFTGTKTLNSFKGTGGATVTNILDEDAMGSNSATALATQQSIKAYVDANTATDREKAFVLNESVDGVATTDNITYTVTHSLNTRNVMVEVIRNGANSGTYQTVYTNIKRTTDDIITVVFGSARTAGNYTVMIQKIG